ncbi:superoxide dismutase [Rhypophila decipiens]|uniref:superoxide dismutase n=1 Tax=Rhypophila decipiens TaxID=261697 RepID=A0AAN6XX05_9PEZI|nr:superoxide dismutase [Rhypophila decipiens]
MQLPTSLLLLATGLATLASAQNDTRVTGKLGDARQVRNNPVIGEVWQAKFNGPVVFGTVTAVAHSVGVNYTIDVTGLDAARGPYKYHVHARAVPESGNCTDTGGHLDSYLRGDTPPCDSTAPQTCEIGDLSGKFGLEKGPVINKFFNDPYSALNIINLGYIGDRGIVFHEGSSARIACATLKKVA